MYSKIMIDVIDGGKPAISVTMKPHHGINLDENEDLRDKMVKMFFEHLGTESSFVGVITEKKNPNIKFLVPMGIHQTLEWLHRTFAEKIAKSSDAVDKVHDLFEGIYKVYYNEPDKAAPEAHIKSGNTYDTNEMNTHQSQ